VVLLGPSGCGKSTLLKVFSGLEKVSSGEISRQKEAQNISCVFQEHRLIPWRNLRKNVSLPLELSSTKNPDKVDYWLKKVRLEDSAKKFPFQISGGMKMRTSLARAMVTEPQLVYLDEPLSALDELTKFELQVEIRKVLKDQKATAVFVTHSINEAAFMADRIVMMSKNGKIVFDEKIELPESRKANLRQSQEYFKVLNQIQSEFESRMGANA
jgi:NitT/TauT family transport system ATP-binding protein